MSESIEKYAKGLLKEIGEDSEREGLAKTPSRVVQLWKDLTVGYKENPDEIIKNSLFETELEDMVLVRDISFYSMCEHHLVPFFGKVHVAYLPNKKIVGISKIAKLVDVFSKRLQVQERLTHEVAETLMKALNPVGVAVVVSARHLCMEMRGIEKVGSEIVTSAMLGAFRKNPATRAEFLSLIKNQ